MRALGEKLDGYPNKHLVMYPFGPPGNLTAAFSRYSPPPNPRDLMPPQLNPPLADVHLWLMYRYEDRDVTGMDRRAKFAPSRQATVQPAGQILGSLAVDPSE